jgi:hypothetical protein
MRLIDADELIKDDEVNLWVSNDAVRTGKTLKMFSELFIKKINEQPTVEAIPKADYKNRLKAEREKIAEDVADKMNYMGSCLNEKNIILGVITGKREILDSLCSTCKSESCVSNGTAISKADYEARLKADMVAMLEELKEQLREMHEDFFETEHFDEAYGVSDSMDVIQQKIDSLKGGEDGKA